MRVPAKVNLQLSVGPREFDGYHNLVSVFQAISIFDDITVSQSNPGSGVTISVTGEHIHGVPEDHSNLAVRAAQLIGEKFDFQTDVHIEILTSMGTHDPIQGNEAQRQKIKWLNKYNIPYKPNFTRNKEEKANYATPSSILIDDSSGCIGPFIAAGGHGILHTTSSETIRILDATFRQIMIIQQLNNHA